MFRRAGARSRRASAGQQFKPTNLAGCVLWLRADLGITIATGVSNWADQSGNGNSFAQATGANQPGLSATGNKRGTGPALTFNGSTQFLSTTAIPLGISTVSLFCVNKAATTAGFQNLVCFGNNTAGQGWGMSIDIAATAKRELNLRGVGTLTDDSATTSWEAWTAQRDGTNWTLRVNGAATSLASTSTPAAQTGGSMVGAEDLSSPGNEFNGSMDEIIGYNRFLSAAEVAQVEAYIRARTAIW